MIIIRGGEGREDRICPRDILQQLEVSALRAKSFNMADLTDKTVRKSFNKLKHLLRGGETERLLLLGNLLLLAVAF